MTDRFRSQLVADLPTLEDRASLSSRMVKLADHDGLPANHPLRIRAVELERRLDCEAPGWTAQNMIGAWERAKFAWAQYTGEAIR